jgi:hypothetical protein
MQNKILKGLVYEVCEIYIDDVLIHGKSDPEFLYNTRCVFDLAEVEYVGHLVSAKDKLKVHDFPQPTTRKEMLQFIGLANYFRDHVPK